MEAHEETYGKRLHAAARKEFRSFWSDYRWWLWIVGMVNFPLLVSAIRHLRGSMFDLGVALIYSGLSLVVSMAGTYAIAMRKAA
ncbi:MAG: hypothetical protein ABI165_09315, partial [Bryobacteraceae bacterium]